MLALPNPSACHPLPANTTTTITALPNHNDRQFARGCRDVFSLLCPDLGAITEVGVRLEPAPGRASGLAGASVATAAAVPPKDWHLQGVEVLHPRLQRRFAFPCGRWLRGGGGGASEVALTGGELEPAASLPRVSSIGAAAGGAAMDAAAWPQLPPLSQHQAQQHHQPQQFDLDRAHSCGAGTGLPPLAALACYRVTVMTGDVEGGGTGEDVALVIYGEAGNTGELRLSGADGDFWRGKVRAAVLCVGGGGVAGAGTPSLLLKR